MHKALDSIPNTAYSRSNPTCLCIPSSREIEWEEKEFKLHRVQDPPGIHATLFTTTTKSKIKEGFGVSVWVRTGHLT